MVCNRPNADAGTAFLPLPQSTILIQGCSLVGSGIWMIYLEQSPLHLKAMIQYMAPTGATSKDFIAWYSTASLAPVVTNTESRLQGPPARMPWCQEPCQLQQSFLEQWGCEAGYHDSWVEDSPLATQEPSPSVVCWSNAVGWLWADVCMHVCHSSNVLHQLRPVVTALLFVRSAFYQWAASNTSQQ